MKTLGLGHLSFLDISPIELVKLARRSGFDFVGLRFYPVSSGHVSWLPDAVAQKELACVMQGEGVRLYDVEAVVIDAALDPKALIPALDAAAALGAERLNTCADVFPALLDRFARICELAAERNISVDLECMAWRGVNTPQACVNLIKQSGAKNAAYLVDSLHHTRCGGTPDDLVVMPQELISSAQFCDAPLLAPQSFEAMIEEARGKRLLPGSGQLPLSEIIAALPKDVTISVELPSTIDTRAPSERAADIYTKTMALFETGP